MANEKLDLISRSALIAEYDRVHIGPPGGARKLMEDAPTVDAVEVVHGHWRYYSTTMQECSNCQRHTARHKFKYCPHCGAKMDGGNEDG